MSGKVMCEYGACEHFCGLDDGDGFSPNLFCEAAEKFIEADNQECLAPDKKAPTESEAVQ